MSTRNLRLLLVGGVAVAYVYEKSQATQTTAAANAASGGISSLANGLSSLASWFGSGTGSAKPGTPNNPASTATSSPTAPSNSLTGGTDAGQTQGDLTDTADPDDGDDDIFSDGENLFGDGD
jgi:hypothetical protein